MLRPKSGGQSSNPCSSLSRREGQGNGGPRWMKFFTSNERSSSNHLPYFSSSKLGMFCCKFEMRIDISADQKLWFLWPMSPYMLTRRRVLKACLASSFLSAVTRFSWAQNIDSARTDMHIDSRLSRGGEPRGQLSAERGSAT